MPFKTLIPEELTHRQRHQYLLGTVNPRPICFASTMDMQGRPNLAPYSFFNIFSSNPPIFIFSANTRRDGSTKDTLENARQTGELVINLVNYPMARQMAICGVEYDTGVNEFEKGGFTPLPSLKVKPLRVKESPVQFECRVLEIKTYSNDPGAANLIVAQALLIHMDENIFGDDETIDPRKLDMVGRLGNFNYTRAQGDSIFAIRQPPTEIAIGFDALPEHLRNSTIITGSQLAMLAGVTYLPSQAEVESFATTPEVQSFLESWNQKIDTLHSRIAEYLNKGETENAWSLVIAVSGYRF
jgi:flavin reductase (DIM6/NTAB) family NADH-FMN oxidoreductase RutF